MQGLASAHEYLRFVVTLTAVVDPFLAVPFFLAFTSTQGEPERRALARLVALTVFAVLAISTFFGETVLELIGASLPAFRVGGGLVCLFTWAALRRAHAIAGRLGMTGLNIATRILGLLLAALAVQTMAEGLTALVPGLA